MDINPSERKRLMEEYIDSSSDRSSPFEKEMKSDGVLGNTWRKREKYFEEKLNEAKTLCKSKLDGVRAGVSVSYRELKIAGKLSQVLFKSKKFEKCIATCEEYLTTLASWKNEDILWWYYVGIFLSDLGFATLSLQQRIGDKQGVVEARFLRSIAQKYYLHGLKAISICCNSKSQLTGKSEMYLDYGTTCFRICDLYMLLDNLEKALKYGKLGLEIYHKHTAPEELKSDDLHIEYLLTMKVSGILQKSMKDYWESTNVAMRFLKRLKSNSIPKFFYSYEETCRRMIADNFNFIGYQDVSLQVYLKIYKTRQEFPVKSISMKSDNEAEFEILFVICSCLHNLKKPYMYSEYFDLFSSCWEQLIKHFRKSEELNKWDEIWKAQCKLLKNVHSGFKDKGIEAGISKRLKIKRCAVCEKENSPGKKELKKCSGCMFFFYCSKHCQIIHWKKGKHKHACCKLV